MTFSKSLDVDVKVPGTNSKTTSFGTRVGCVTKLLNVAWNAETNSSANASVVQSHVKRLTAGIVPIAMSVRHLLQLTVITRRLFFSCGDCGYNVCGPCRDVNRGRITLSCKLCHEFFCEECRDYIFCGRCDRGACGECFEGSARGVCDNVYCRLCLEDGNYCDECNRFYSSTPSREEHNTHWRSHQSQINA